MVEEEEADTAVVEAHRPEVAVVAAGGHIAVDMVAVAGAAAHREEAAAGDGVYRLQVPEQAGEEL